MKIKVKNAPRMERLIKAREEKLKSVKELKDFTKSFVLKQDLTKKELEESFTEFLGFDVKFEKGSNMQAYHEMICTLELKDQLLFLDFAYLLDRYNNICIIEFLIDSENNLIGKENNKIIGVFTE